MTVSQYNTIQSGMGNESKRFISKLIKLLSINKNPEINCSIIETNKNKLWTNKIDANMFERLRRTN